MRQTGRAGAETPLSKWGGGGGGGADLRLNKPTCLFAIVKSGLDQTSKCSRPAIVCLVQSAGAVGFQNDIMCTVIWLGVYTEVFMILLNHRTWLLIRYF